MKKLLIAAVLGLTTLVLSPAMSPALADGHTPEERLSEAGFTLPAPTKPIANYVTWRRAGNILYLSGHGECGSRTVGKVGDTLTTQQGYASAQKVGLCMLATIKDAVGDLSNVKQVLQILGMVNSAPDFGDQPKVVNGFSDLFVVAFGVDGKGARAAIGMNSLPGQMAVEINAVIELRD
jgi:enamine deaminase RidA (YjgF/YER057c/UK114 family)